MQEITELLGQWAAWRGDSVLSVMRIRRTPQCTLGRLVKMARQKGEIWKHNDPDIRESFDDEEMCRLDRIIAGLEWRYRNVIFLAHVDGVQLSPPERARKMGCSERHYRRVLAAAYLAIEQYLGKGLKMSAKRAIIR